MQQKIIKLTPDQLGYQDRGKMKWMGMLLSDHAESLKKIKEQEANYSTLVKKEQDDSQLSTRLYQAYTSKQPVLIQANIVRNGLFSPEIPCIILGFFGEFIHFKKQDQSTFKASLHQIRYVEWMDPNLWYNKKE